MSRFPRAFAERNRVVLALAGLVILAVAFVGEPKVIDAHDVAGYDEGTIAGRSG